jgi:hypothetical protein
MSQFKALRIPLESSIPALISAKLSFELMVFFPQEALFVVRSGWHDIMRVCQVGRKLDRNNFTHYKAQKVMRKEPHFSTATIRIFNHYFLS